METIFIIPSTTTEWILGAALLSLFIIQITYYLTVMNRVGNFKYAYTPKFTSPVSVIVCAKNEAENLQKFIPLIMQQQYPNFEVIVVNDSSTDDSEMVLAQLKLQYPNLYYTSIPADKRFNHSKKLAVNIGIKAAKHEHLLFTDADCQPASNQWIAQMASGFCDNNKQLIVGFSPYIKEKGLLNLMIRFDNFWSGVQYLGFALKNNAYMAVGRNMAYTKTLFAKVGGFNKHLYIESGDDDLFVQQAADKNNTATIFSPESHMLTAARNTLYDWAAQKSRHLTTAPLYKTSHKFLLTLEPLTRQSFWLIAFYALFLQSLWIVAAGLLLIRLIVQLLVLKKASKVLAQRKIYWSILLFDITLPFILGYLYIGNLFRTKQIKWK